MALLFGGLISLPLVAHGEEEPATESVPSLLPGVKLPPGLPQLPKIRPSLSPEGMRLLAQDGGSSARERLERVRQRRRERRERLRQKRAERSSAGSTAAKPADESSTSGESARPSWQQAPESNRDPSVQELSRSFIERCPRVSPRTKVYLEIYNEELESVVKLIACLKQQNIIVPQALKGKKISIYSPVPVTINEAYRAFLTALEANGLTISRQGRFWRIIPIKDYARASDPIRSSESPPPVEDRMITQIVQLKHVDGQEINEILSRLASSNAQIIVYQPSNSLIITELASNLRKLLTLIDRLDQPGGEEKLWTYQILHAEAAEIAQKIQEIFEVGEQQGGGKNPRQQNKSRRARNKRGRGKQSRGGNSQAGVESSSIGQSDLAVRVSKVIADERTNRLFILASSRNYARVKALIASLDIPVEGDGQVHIHQLNHAKAVDLASVLSNLSQEQRGRQGGNGRARKRSNSSSRKGNSSRRRASSGASGNSAALFEGEVSVTADEDTNSLVITASFKDYLS
ncbi:MAG: secretin N-terminal domain-containing protein, partial [Myxococcota bacterium]|nr:secretin N-terminal domain-containing protein [Myxococcota bacterium]